jgi:hypothetical protein
MDDATTPARRTIEVSDEVYEVLRRTAEHRGTDIGGAVRYLLQVPPVPAEASHDDE